MTRLASPRPNRVEGYVGGINENAPPATAKPDGVTGTLDQAVNLFATGPGKLAVRGGSKVKQTFASALRMLYLRPFTPTGAMAVYHADVAPAHHYASRLTTDLAFFTGVEATSQVGLGAVGGWTKETPARPIGAELFEKIFLADATIDYSARAGLCAIDGAGTVTAVAFDFGGGAETLKPYVCEEYNNTLFIAGYENKALSADSPAYLRHSFLGVSPEQATGFDTDAWLIVGAKGQRITGLKKGRGLLLVAKGNELWRVSGFGIQKPGWTFAIDAVESTQGMGVSNPYALCYAGGDTKGYWYGIGESGPWRSDGFSVESLVKARRRSWAKATNLGFSWACYHPDRDVVLFGLNQTPVPSGRSASYPTIIWVWDCQREVWISDITMSADMMIATAIPTSTVSGPTATPSALAFTHASATTSTVAATWVNGDATASTELWVRAVSGGGSVLWATAAPASTSATLSGLAAGVNYKVTIRHIKSGVASEFVAEVDAYTVIPAVATLSFTSHGDIFTAAVDIGHGAVSFESGGVEYNTVPVTAPGLYNSSGQLGTHAYRARSFDSAWPAAIQYGAYSNTIVVTL